MATTVATLRAALMTRLNVGSTALEPTTAMVDQWIRDGFLEGFTIFQPVFKAASTAISNDAVALTADRILYVLVDGLVLVEGEEWHHGATGVEGLPRRYTGLTPTVYYTNTPDLTGATIESSCIFGDNWLEPYVALFTEVLMLERLAQTAASQGGERQAAMSRVVDAKRDRLERLMLGQRSEFIQGMEANLQRRMGLGPHVRRQHAWAGYRNRGGTKNALVGR